MNPSAEARLKELQLVLPPVPKPAGIYKPVVVVGSMLYVSGQGPIKNDGTQMTGRVGDGLTLEEGRLAARQVALTMLATIKAHGGSLDGIKRLVKTLGMVNSAPSFGQQPAVINGFSEIMVQVFGEENGIGARSAVGMILPENIAVEVEAIFELR